MNNRIANKLSDCRTGQKVIVCSIDCGHNLREKILVMGILPGETIDIIDARKNGTCLINSGESRLALDSKTADSIICVEE